MDEKRCTWCNMKNPKYIEYHDKEWCVPNFDDKYLYEMLILESFQAGLSWECVLNKRESFRLAYDGFDIEKVCAYDEDKINELRNNKDIIRNKLKINASVSNSKIFKSIVEEFGSFHNYLKQFTADKIIYEIGKTTNELSDVISNDLKKRGMKFVGSTIIYSYLQAVGVIYSHDRDCFLYKEENRELYVPSKIKAMIAGKSYELDDIGMSGNQVLIFEDMVLKIEESSATMEEQVKLMNWLEGKLFAPKVLAYEVEDEKSYLLMSKMEGKMSCDTYYLENPEILLKALAQGLHMLWKVDIEGCPRVRDLDTVLREARYQVENDLVDIENVEPTTFGEGGFESPIHLLEWLEQNRPPYEPVFSHGDHCLPNVFLEEDQVKGYIDLDRAGVCDKWNDIALCYRSLKHNFDGTYGGKVYEDFEAEKLFEALGMEADWEKIRYYLLLDELF